MYFTIDKAIIGDALGLTVLGYYLMSFRWANFGTVQITQMISGVVFPTFSKINDDIDRLKKGYLLVLRYTSLIVLPFIIGIISIADIFVEVVLTEKWFPIILPLQFLCITSLFRSLGSTIGNVFMATSNPQILSFLSIFQLLIVLFFLDYSLDQGGLLGGVKLLMVIEIIGVLCSLFFLSRIINLSFLDVFNSFILFVFSTLIMYFAVTFLKTLMIYNLTNLVVLVVFGLFTYLFSLALFSRGKIYSEIKKTILS